MAERHDTTQEAEAAAAGNPPAAAAPEDGASEIDLSDADAVAPDAKEPAPTQPTSSAGTGEADAELDPAAEYLELARRTQADFENYRKRMARENAQASGRGTARLAKELLPALDHLELALKAAGEGGNAEVVRGFAMVRDELVAGLGRAGIERFSPDGEPFDPNEHEAMAQQPVEEAEPGTVVSVYQQGYRMGGAVLRPARVVVAQ